MPIIDLEKKLIGIQTVTMHVSKPFDLLYFSTEPELKTLQEVFRTTCSMGLHQLWPKLGEGREKMLKWGDIINVIAPHRMGNHILRSGVQIKYDGCNMHLMINNEKYIYVQSRIELEANLCPCLVFLLTICHNTPAILVPVSSEKDSDALQIETEFSDTNTGNVLVICGVYNNCIEAEIVEPLQLNGEIVSYTDCDFVAQCVHRYN